MSRLTQKLKSQRGVAILYALFLFLVCAFVAGATLTAAYNSAARSTLARKEQQAYLAVASAADLVKGAVENKSMSMDYITHTEDILDEEGKVIGSDTTYSTTISAPYDGELSKIGTRVYDLFQEEKLRRVPPSAQTYGLTFLLDGYDDLENVTGTLTVGEDYSITVLLHNKDSKGNAVRISCEASKNVVGGSTQTTQVSWGDAIITPTTAP